MKLLQLRQGFATNSSSTHSIIIANPLTKVVLTGEPLGKGDDYRVGEFGWDHFTIASKEGRMEYYAHMIRANLFDLPSWMQETLAYSVTGIHTDKSGYIDHQSIFSLPREWNGQGLNKQFLDELKEFLLQENVMILGGSDNSDDSHRLASCGPRVLTGIPHGHGHWVCRKDGEEWTFFNRDEGTKVTFTFNGEVKERKRPNAPELIDVKITNFCPYGCSYCYQDSTTMGKHASVEAIRHLTYECEDNRVFEVALGGGEPTLHPEFTYILSMFRDKGVVPNFTTRNLVWLRDEKQRVPILEHCGAFAVSVTEAETVRELGDISRRYGIEDKTAIHYVLGSNEIWVFDQILKECSNQGFRLVLLGWKTTGRGKGGASYDNSKWLQTTQTAYENKACPALGIDTHIACEYESQLKQAKIPEWLIYKEEGKFSMYYDAVENRFGPSSFCEEEEYIYPYPEYRLTDKDPNPMKTAWNKLDIKTKQGNKKDKKKTK